MVVYNFHLGLLFACNGHCCYNVTVNCMCKCMLWSLNVRYTAVAVWAEFFLSLPPLVWTYLLHALGFSLKV